MTPAIISNTETTCAIGNPPIFKTLSILKYSTKIQTTEYKIKYQKKVQPDRVLLRIKISTVKTTKSKKDSYKNAG